MESQKEIYRSVLGYEDILKVSNKGNVIKLKRTWVNGNNGGVRTIDEHVMKLRQSLGYNVIDIYVNGKKKILKVHRLVAEAFILNKDNKPCVNHKDLNRANNNVSNLEWVTYKENAIHARKNRKFKFNDCNHLRGEDVHTSKINDKKAKDIRSSKLSNKELAIIYNLDASTISRIKNNKYWKHV